MSKINLSKNFIRGICKSALNEDLYPSGDISSNLLKNNIKKILYIEGIRHSVESKPSKHFLELIMPLLSTPCVTVLEKLYVRE
mgnify:CR=1 FL=1